MFWPKKDGPFFEFEDEKADTAKENGWLGKMVYILAHAPRDSSEENGFEEFMPKSSTMEERGGSAQSGHRMEVTPAANEPLGLHERPDPIEPTQEELEEQKSRHRQQYGALHVDRDVPEYTPSERLENVFQQVEKANDSPKGNRFVQPDKELMASEFPDVPVETREKYTSMPQAVLEDFYGALEALQREHAMTAEQAKSPITPTQEEAAVKSHRTLADIKRDAPDLFEGIDYSPKGETYEGKISAADIDNTIDEIIAASPEVAAARAVKGKKRPKGPGEQLKKAGERLADAIKEPENNVHVDSVNDNKEEPAVTRNDSPPKPHDFDTVGVKQEESKNILTQEEELALYEDIGQEISKRIQEVKEPEINEPSLDDTIAVDEKSSKSEEGIDPERFKKLQEKLMGYIPEDDDRSR